MKAYMTRCILIGFLWTVAVPAYGEQLCEYEVYSPNALQAGIVHQFALSGLAVTPDFGARDQTKQSFAIFQSANQKVGTVTFELSLIKRSSRLVFRAVEGTPLLEATETIFPCPASRPTGRCYQTTITDEFTGGGPTEEAAFMILDTPHGVEWYRYGQRIHSVSWRSEFTPLIDWLVDYYRETPAAKREAFATRFAALEFALMSDPYLWPYRPYLHFTEGRHGGISVSGTVRSNFIYHRISRILMDLGYYQMRNWIRIDTGFVPDHSRMRPVYESCL